MFVYFIHSPLAWVGSFRGSQWKTVKWGRFSWLVLFMLLHPVVQSAKKWIQDSAFGFQFTFLNSKSVLWPTRICKRRWRVTLARSLANPFWRTSIREVKYSVEMYYLWILPPNLLLYGERTTTCGGRGGGVSQGQIWLVRHVVRLIDLQFLTPLTECFPLSLSHMDTWDKFKHLCEVWDLKRQVIFFTFQFPFYRLTQRLDKTDISVSGNGKKCLFLHNLISKPRMNPFRVAEDTNLSHFPRKPTQFQVRDAG